MSERMTHPIHVIGPNQEDGGYFTCLRSAAERIAYLLTAPMRELALPKGAYHAKDELTGISYPHKQCIDELGARSVFGHKDRTSVMFSRKKKRRAATGKRIQRKRILASL